MGTKKSSDVWQGTLSIMVLKTLNMLGPQHGYGLARRIESRRGSAFYLCGRAETDPAYARYPRLPVRECPGYERATGSNPDSGEQ